MYTIFQTATSLDLFKWGGSSDKSAKTEVPSHVVCLERYSYLLEDEPRPTKA